MGNFDYGAARAAKEAGMAQADEHASKRWKAAAHTAVFKAALRLPLLTSDDVVERIDPAVFTHELRAMGPVMTRAAKEGWIVKADMGARPSVRRTLHASPRTVWRSLICLG